MRFCSNCGNPIEDTARFCPNCGTPAVKLAEQAEEKAAVTVEDKTETAAAIVEQPISAPLIEEHLASVPEQPLNSAPQPSCASPAPEQPPFAPAPQPSYTPSQPNYGYPNGYSVPPMPGYYPQPTTPPPEDPRKTKVASTGGFFIMELLYAIPVIGFILSVILSFAHRNDNMKHYARSKLIWSLIAVILGAVGTVLWFVLLREVISASDIEGFFNF